MLTRDQLLQARPLAVERVSLPAFGDAVFVRELTVSERDGFEGKVYAAPSPDFRGELLARSLCDEAGKRLFEDDEVKCLVSLGAAAMQPAFMVAMRLSALRVSDLEELLGNSIGEAVGGSSSVSPSGSG
jgi:hypothetical protein